jgi:hypothetical protein
MWFKLKSITTRMLVAGLIPCVAVMVLDGCSLLRSSSSKSITGGVSVTNEKQGSASVGGPSKIYVQDFSLDVSDLKTDSGVGGLADQASGAGGILGRVSQRISRGSISGGAEVQVPQIIAAMSEELVSGFRKRGIPAERLKQDPVGGSGIGWLVKGHFVDIDEGNRAQRAALGFGMGATQMDVKVEVMDLSAQDPGQPFLVFGTSKEAGMKPGGFNPYVIAAKFRMERKATVEDVQKTADEIVGEILKSRDLLK